MLPTYRPNGLESLEMEPAAWAAVSSPSSDTNKSGLNARWRGPCNSISNVNHKPLRQAQQDQEKQEYNRTKISSFRQFAGGGAGRVCTQYRGKQSREMGSVFPEDIREGWVLRTFIVPVQGGGGRGERVQSWGVGMKQIPSWTVCWNGARSAKEK